MPPLGHLSPGPPCPYRRMALLPASAADSRAGVTRTPVQNHRPWSPALVSPGEVVCGDSGPAADGRTQAGTASLLQASLPQVVISSEGICQRAKNEDHDSKAGGKAAGKDDESTWSPRSVIQQLWGQPCKEWGGQASPTQPHFGCRRPPSPSTEGPQHPCT